MGSPVGVPALCKITESVRSKNVVSMMGKNSCNEGYLTTVARKIIYPPASLQQTLWQTEDVDEINKELHSIISSHEHRIAQ